VTVIDVARHPESLSLTITSEFEAPPTAVWRMWSDPRLLERWWGPPTHPATFVEHDLTPGATVTYFMTGPDGERYHGWWRVVAVDVGRSVEVEDGFADDDGVPNPDLPVTTMRVELTEARSGVTRMTITSVFPSAEAMEQVLSMGAAEGMAQALGQIDQLLASAA
jgi:uncharacterized protein YndB with AHSA1/START domain